MARVTSYHYSVVDVFTLEPLAGNPLAVFLNASELDGTTMQKIARELNLAETAFVLPARRDDCMARIRIFTPAREMAFAGHPTVGAAFVLLQEQQVARNTSSFSLEEEVGPVWIRIEGHERPLIWVRMPPIEEGKCYDSALCARVLGLEAHDLLPIEPQWLSAGNPTIIVAVTEKAAVDRAWLDQAGLKTLKGIAGESCCVFVFTPTRDGVYSRMFAPEYGIPEDPASGSCTGPLAVFMMRRGLISSASGTRFVSEQGAQMGRRSLLHVEIDGQNGANGIYVGGHVTPIVEAVMTLGGN
jgi:trans-2,3-dihydro-3-hydroxyanthranilate isomerase